MGLSQPYTPPAASGGSVAPGVPVVTAIPFAYNTASIRNGAAVYTPVIDDVLLDAWVEITEAWDGTTPRGDVWTHGVDGYSALWSASTAGGGLDMTENAYDNCGIISHNQTAHLGSIDAVVQTKYDLAVSGAALAYKSAPAAGHGANLLPGRFTTTDPMVVVVSQDGTAGGADPAPTQGSAVLYLVTVTPKS